MNQLKEVLDLKNIQQKLQTVQKGLQVECYETISSTNIRAKAWAKEGAPSWSVVFSQQQTSGKGRLGKRWVSPKGEGIWMSIILKPDISVEKAPMLTLVAGLSMCKVIQDVTHLKAKIKWPNDIVIGNKKVCGILTEMQVKDGQVEYVVIGIGVNVNTTNFPQDLPYATSLAMEGEKQYNKEALITCFFKTFYQNYHVFEKEGFSGIREEYKQNCVTVHADVRIIEGLETYTAFIEDIDEWGQLIAKTSQGEKRKILSGEVSIRGLYGYVDE